MGQVVDGTSKGQAQKRGENLMNVGTSTDLTAQEEWPVQY